jgi:uncharacterized protein (TIGR02246 family)
MKNVILGSCFVLLAACATTNPNNDIVAGDAENAIRRMDADFNASIAAGSVDGMMKIYADNAVLMPPNTPVMRGRDAIRQYWTAVIGSGKVEATVTADDITQSCDMATEIGHYNLAISPAGGAPMRDTGKYVITWRRIDGQWRAVADIFNSDLPK